MPEVSRPNYPDILSYITGGKHHDSGVIQTALAVRPGVIPAGGSFEMLLLLQNLSDVNINVSVRAHLPERDARGQKNRFVCKVERLSVDLRPAEVGYVILPVSCVTDTAPQQDYTVGLEVETKSSVKPRRIRRDGETSEVNLDYYFYLPESSTQEIIELKKLPFSNHVHGSGKPVLETSIHIEGAKIGTLRSFRPKWVSLWALGDHTDVRPLLERYGGVLSDRVLPRLKAVDMFEPLETATKRRMGDKGFAIQPAESHFIAKLLAVMLEETVSDGGNGMPLRQILKQQWPVDGKPIPMPNWCRALLDAVGYDQTLVDYPVRAFTDIVYDDLLRDAIFFGFKLLQGVTGEELGTESEIRQYGEQVTDTLRDASRQFTFIDVYIPLVLGGMIVNDRFRATHESTLALIADVNTIVDGYRPKWQPNHDVEFQMIEMVMNKVLEKYRDWT